MGSELLNGAGVGHDWRVGGTFPIGGPIVSVAELCTVIPTIKHLIT